MGNFNVRTQDRQSVLSLQEKIEISMALDRLRLDAVRTDERIRDENEKMRRLKEEIASLESSFNRC